MYIVARRWALTQTIQIISVNCSTLLLNAGHLEGPCILELLIGYDGALDVQTITAHGVDKWLVVAEESDLSLAGGYRVMEEEF